MLQPMAASATYCTSVAGITWIGSLLELGRGPIEEGLIISGTEIFQALTYEKKKAEDIQSNSTPVLSPPKTSSGRP